MVVIGGPVEVVVSIRGMAMVRARVTIRVEVSSVEIVRVRVTSTRNVPQDFARRVANEATMVGVEIARIIGD